MDGFLEQSAGMLNGKLSTQKELRGSMNMPGVVRDYDGLTNKPEINGVTVEGNKTGTEFGLVDQEDLQSLSTVDLLNILNIF